MSNRSKQIIFAVVYIVALFMTTLSCTVLVLTLPALGGL